MTEIAQTTNSGGSLNQSSSSIEATSGQSLYREAIDSGERESLIKSQFEKLSPEQRSQLADQFVGAASRDGINKLAETPDGQHALKEIYNNASEDKQAFMRQVHKAQGTTAVDYTASQSVAAQNPTQKQAAESPSYSCQVVSGPQYERYDNKAGEDIRRPTFDGFRKTYILHSAAEFAHDPKSGKLAGCCEVRQYIAWDAKFHATHGKPPHESFPASAKPNTFYEDRDNVKGDRYGHRTSAYKSTDGYETNGVPDQQNGNKFVGYDTTRVRFDAQGKFTFHQTVIDQCNGGSVVAKSDPVTIDWSNPNK